MKLSISKFVPEKGMEDVFGDNPVLIEALYDATDIDNEVVVFEYEFQLLNKDNEILNSDDSSSQIIRSPEELDLSSILSAGKSPKGLVKGRLRYRLFTSESTLGPNIPHQEFQTAVPKKGATTTFEIGQHATGKVSLLPGNYAQLVIKLNDVDTSSEDWRLVSITRDDDGSESGTVSSPEDSLDEVKSGFAGAKSISGELMVLGANDWVEIESELISL